MSSEATENPHRACPQTEPRHRDPSAALGTLAFVSALVFVGYGSPQPWTAAGLVCVTAAACVASPELMRGALQAGSARLIGTLAVVIGRAARLAGRVVIALMILFVALLAIAGAPRSQAITAGACFLIIIGLVKFFAWQMRYLISDLIGGGQVDREIARRWAHLRWPLAGVCFVAGKLLQLAGTFSG